MVRPGEVEWLVAAAAANGLHARIGPHAIGMEAVAQSNTAGVPWSVRARVDVHVSSQNAWTDRYVVCTSPTLAAPLLCLEQVQAGAVPTRVHVQRNDRDPLGATGELLADAAVAAVQIVGMLWRQKRREARGESPDRPPTVDLEPEDALSAEVIAALRTWGGRLSDVPFILSAAMDTPLTLRVTYWDDAAAFAHQIEVWRTCVERLAGAGLLVQRDEASIAGAKDHTQACAQVVMQRRLEELRRSR